MGQIEQHRSLAVDHHFHRGVAWLEESTGGSATIALSYAAFEFRLQLERLMLHYWQQVHQQSGAEKNVHDIKKLGNMRRAIRDLVGDQAKINRHFEYSRALLEMIGIGYRLPTPDLGKLQSHWETCSDLCHITWTLDSQDETLTAKAFEQLMKTRAWLDFSLASIGWPDMNTVQPFQATYEKFMASEMSLEEAVREIQAAGLYAVVIHPDGSCEFAGATVPPT